ncbi:hypothetical protein E3N88_34929 [Mikania micrantha]|nr:hypothetical protein E3N88_34929 [Mikania micrantha]
MMNVGENRAQNGVRMLPESRNEVKNQNGDADDVGRLNSIMELKVLIFELYLVNPCVAEQKTLIVLLVDTPFAGRIASPLV